MPGPAVPSPDKLFKLRPLLDHLFEKFQEAYVPSLNSSIDESLLLWKGRLSFKQYILLKRARFEVKSFILCEDSGPGSIRPFPFWESCYCPYATFAEKKGIIFILIIGMQACLCTSTFIAKEP